MRAALIVVLFAATAVSSAGDTIVLKNGHRITAANVTEDAQHVSYETPAGRMSIPRAIVARIERDSLGYSPAASVSEAAASVPQAPPVRGYEDVFKLAVHDNSIDYAYIANLETDARSGLPQAVAKATAAHYAAAQFLIAQGDLNSAADQYRQALIFAPDNVPLLLNLAALDLRESKFTAALDPLEHAGEVAGDSGPEAAVIAKLMGWAYYGANKTSQAIREWKRSEELHPDAQVEQALVKAQKDQQVEEGFREGETQHFALKYYGGAAPDLAHEILRVLESDFDDIQSQLDYAPPNQISVILYTQQTFEDITRAPDWAGAIYDGRLRIPVQGLTSVTPELARVLKHELTHSFITQKSDGRAPTWLQEGVAQWMEGRRSTGDAGALVNAAEQGSVPSLKSLEGSWLTLPTDSAGLNYAWSLAVVEAMIQNDGMSDVSRLIDRMATAPTPEDAVRQVLHCGYDDLQHQTIDYLRNQYLQ